MREKFRVRNVGEDLQDRTKAQGQDRRDRRTFRAKPRSSCWASSMLGAESLEEALRLAGGIPIAEFGTTEVRAVYDVPGR